MEFRGIEITTTNAYLAKSRVLAAVNEEYASKNVTYIDKLSDVMESGVVKPDSEAYKDISNVFTLIKMNYQVCNGGVTQYYWNGYNSGRAPHTDNDCEIYDKDCIKDILDSDIYDIANVMYGTDAANTVATMSERWDNIEHYEACEEECGYCRGTGTLDSYYDEDEGEYVDEYCDCCGGSGYVEEAEYISGDRDFEECLYNFKEYDTILEAYAEYVYKKHFEVV